MSTIQPENAYHSQKIGQLVGVCSVMYYYYMLFSIQQVHNHCAQGLVDRLSLSSPVRLMILATSSDTHCQPPAYD